MIQRQDSPRITAPLAGRISPQWHRTAREGDTPYPSPLSVRPSGVCAIGGTRRSKAVSEMRCETRDTERTELTMQTPAMKGEVVGDAVVFLGFCPNVCGSLIHRHGDLGPKAAHCVDSPAEPYELRLAEPCEKAATHAVLVFMRARRFRPLTRRDRKARVRVAVFVAELLLSVTGLDRPRACCPCSECCRHIVCPTGGRTRS